jgi:DUF1680 family protein
MPLDGLHGNTQVPKLLGSAARHAYSGDASDQVAATFFWDRVVRHHTFATGGHDKDEYLREPDRLSHITDGRTAESRQRHGESRAAGLALYYESGDRLWINLYTPSTARWDAAGVTLEMQTSFPEGENATLKVSARSPKPFTLLLLRPSWTTDGFSVSVNGEVVKSLSGPGTYIELTRTWKTGDTVSLTLPKVVRIERLRDDATRAAINPTASSTSTTGYQPIAWRTTRP